MARQPVLRVSMPRRLWPAEAHSLRPGLAGRRGGRSFSTITYQLYSVKCHLLEVLQGNPSRC